MYICLLMGCDDDVSKVCAPDLTISSAARTIRAPPLKDPVLANRREPAGAPLSPATAAVQATFNAVCPVEDVLWEVRFGALATRRASQLASRDKSSLSSARWATLSVVSMATG